MRRFWLRLLIWQLLAWSVCAAPIHLLLVAADDATLQPLRAKLTGIEPETRAAWTLWRGELYGKKVALARTEGDPLNAVAVTTLAVRLHPPQLIVVFGVSRAHDPDLRKGDIVVSERFAAFDGMISPVAALGGGSNSLRWRRLLHPLMTAGERETPTEFFPADTPALLIARTFKTPHGRVLAGVLGSANQVNREADRVVKLRKDWQTSCEDGESAHVAGVAALFNVPVIGFRVVDGDASDAADFALRFVEAWK